MLKHGATAPAVYAPIARLPPTYEILIILKRGNSFFGGVSFYSECSDGPLPVGQQSRGSSFLGGVSFHSECSDGPLPVRQQSCRGS